MNEPVRNIVVISAPAYEPVTLATARLYCNIDADLTGQDDIIRLLITAARERAEEITGRAFVERTLELRLDQFPDEQVIELPFAPLQYVETITYTDTAGVEHTLQGQGSPDEIHTDTGSTPGRIAPLYGASWPSSNGMPGSVRIRYLAGYAAVGSPHDGQEFENAMPARLKQWMAARVSTWYENRDHLDLANLKELPRDFVDGLLDGLIAHRRFA